MLIKMSSSRLIELLICIMIFSSSTCKGDIDKRVNSKLLSNQVFNVTNQDLENAIQYGTHHVNIFSCMEDTISYAKIHVTSGTPSHGQLINSKPSLEGQLESRNAEIIIKASQYIMSNYCLRYGFNEMQCAKRLTKVRLDRTSLGRTCLSKFYNRTSCNKLNLLYRSSDGSCNNLRHGFWGKSNTAYKRLLFPAYEDGISSMKELPNPRKLSTSFVNDEESVDCRKTLAMAFWTIFIGHDLSQTALSSMLTKNQSVECCNKNGMGLMLHHRHPFCAPITIPENDEFYSPLCRNCMNYVRSMPAMRTSCTFGPREQTNLVTHYLDASMLYGSSEEQTLSLRKRSLGLLLMVTSDINQMQMLPLVNGSQACQSGKTCFRSGDWRVNTQPHLTAMYTLWAREHNRIAIQLSLINLHWDDERTFQETRKIIIAFIQHITYSEWLPALLGKGHADTRELELLQEGYSDMYDDTEEPMVGNSFATVILPFANSMLNETLRLYPENRMSHSTLSLKDHYNRPSNYLQLNYMDDLVRGLSTQNTQQVDMLFTKTMTNFLYSFSDDNSFGMDIVSLDLQRSRDHGIPSYTQFRKYCELNDIKSVTDLMEIMVDGAADKLLKQYKSWDDIDLMIGALFEKRDEDSMVGPTMACIITDQFVRTRLADRYFYDLPNVFIEPQLAEIRKMTLARLFCDNSKQITTMQQNVFYQPKFSVDLLQCESSLIPKINLSFWAETIELEK